jgi:hypothetical protein
MKFLSTLAFILVSAFVAIAQMQPACPEGSTYHDGVCEASTASFLARGGWVLIIGIPALLVAIFIGRKVFRKLGGKSERTADSEGGIH